MQFNEGRDAVAQAYLAQQGLLPPGGQFPTFGDTGGAIANLYGGPLGDPNYQGHSPASSQQADFQTGFGAFGGRGGADREGFGTNVSDPALASPSLTDPGYSNVSPYGREGDDTSAQSQASQASQAASMAAAAMAAQTGGYGLPAGGFSAGGGKTGAPAATGWGGWSDFATTPAGAPSTYGSSTFAQPGATPVSTTSFTAPPSDAPVDVFEQGYNDFFGAPPAGALPSPGIFDPGGSRSSPTMVGTVHPGGYDPDQNGPDQNGPGDSTGWGGGGPIGGSGFGGFGAFGGGAATGGFEGSASMGNTTGAQGFNAGAGGYGDFGAASPGTGGFSAAAAATAGFNAGFEAGAAAATGDMGTGGADGAGSGAGSGGGSGSSGGQDAGGSSPGGVG